MSLSPIEIHEDDDNNYTLIGEDSFEWRGIKEQFEAQELGLA